MPANSLIITNAGAAAIVAAAANGTNAVVITSCGLSNTHATYTSASTALTGQFKTINNISGGAVDAATIHLSFADQSNDAYDLRAIALYLSDGTLFAIYSQATPIYTKPAGTDGLLSVNIKLLNNNSSQIQFGNTNIFNPPANETQFGVVRRATSAEVTAGTNNDKFVTPKHIKDANFWHAGNDGAGSGLDADLLDGQNGTYFLDLANATGLLASARLSGTYNISISGNAATATNSTQLGGIASANFWNSGNDGAGSGLDADLFDGFDSTYFLKANSSYFAFRSNAANGYLSINEGTPSLTGYLSFYNAAGTLFGFIGQGAGNAIGLTTAAGKYYNFNATPMALGNAMWHAGNDGAGSGLDADLLDGQNGTYFLDLANATGLLASARLSGTYNISISGNAATATNSTQLGGIASANFWHSGNDGAGSGLDADLLDGLDSKTLISVPQNTQAAAYVLLASDNGKHINISAGGITIPSGVFSAGETVTIYNNSGANQIITQGAGVTLRLVGTATTGNRTLAQYGLCTLLCVAANTFVITGGGLS